MNIKRLLAVILAVLALLSFVGCNVKKDTGKEPLNAAGGKADEAMSENQPESTDAQASDTASEAAAGFLLAGILVPKIVEKLGKRADSRRFFQICCVSAIVLHLLFALTTYGGLVNKPAGQSASIFTAILVILFTGLTTIPLEFKNLMQKEMEAETVDYIEWKTGRRVEGIMLSIMSFTGKIENTFASSIGIAILGVVGYVSHTEGSLIQNHSTNLALFAMTTIVPAIGYLLMLIPIHFYNITAETRELKRRWTWMWTLPA